MRKIKQVYHIKAPVSEVWGALVDPNYIEGWGGGPAKMTDKKGNRFELWSGDIYGKNLEFIKNKKLVQEWYGSPWKELSVATFEIIKEENGTRIDFFQENVPDKEYEDINTGWKDYYLGSLKDFLEQRKDQD